LRCSKTMDSESAVFGPVGALTTSEWMRAVSHVAAEASFAHHRP
jgi:hypothetical protein